MIENVNGITSKIQKMVLKRYYFKIEEKNVWLFCLA